MISYMNRAAQHERSQPEPQLALDTRSLYEALSELIRIYQFRDRDRICCNEISVTQCYALEALVTLAPITVNALAARLYLNKSTTSRVVDALERKGYAARSQDPEDGRVVRLRATAKGRMLHEKILDRILAEERELIREFPPEVRKSMVLLLRSLTRAAERKMNEGGSLCCR